MKQISLPPIKTKPFDLNKFMKLSKKVREILIKEGKIEADLDLDLTIFVTPRKGSITQDSQI